MMMESTPLLSDDSLNSEDELNAIKIVLLGKTGSGKSSFGNTLSGGSARFSVSHSAASETKKCQSETVTVNGRQLCLIDTIGYLDTDKDNTTLSSGDVEYLLDCAPAVHAFLILLKVEKYTKTERDMMESIRKQFTEEALKYTTVVFTHGDQLPDEITIESWVNDDRNVSSLVQRCGGGCIVVDNKYWNNSDHDYRNNTVQTKKLLQTIEDTSKRNGGMVYTTSALQHLEGEIQEEMKTFSRSRKEAKLSLLQKIKITIRESAIGLLIIRAARAVYIPLLVIGAYIAVAVGGMGACLVRKKSNKKNN